MTGRRRRREGKKGRSDQCLGVELTFESTLLWGETIDLLLLLRGRRDRRILQSSSLDPRSCSGSGTLVV